MRFLSLCGGLSTFSIVAYDPQEEEYIDGVVLEFLREKFGG